MAATAPCYYAQGPGPTPPEDQEDLEEVEGPTPLERLGSACHELVSALGSITTQTVTSGVLRLGRVMNRVFYARAYMQHEVGRLRERKEQILNRNRIEQSSQQRVDWLEQQLEELKQEMMQMRLDSSCVNTAFTTPSATPRPPNTGPHCNPSSCGVPATTTEIEGLDLLQGALDMIVANQSDSSTSDMPVENPVETPVQQPIEKSVEAPQEDGALSTPLPDPRTPQRHPPAILPTPEPSASLQSPRPPLPFNNQALALQRAKLHTNRDKSVTRTPSKPESARSNPGKQQTPASQKKLAEPTQKADTPLESLSNLTPDCLLNQKGRLRPSAKPSSNKPTPSKNLPGFDLQAALKQRFKDMQHSPPSPAGWQSE